MHFWKHEVFPDESGNFCNELDRGKPENHKWVYLVCAGFEKNKEREGCIDPYIARWPHYMRIRTFQISDSTEIVVFAHTPSPAGINVTSGV